MTRGTSRDYTHPYRPALVGLYNRIGSLGPDGPLSAATLIASARRAERRDRFDDEASVVSALEHLVAALAGEARLSPFGKLITRQRLVASLRIRLRAQAWFERVPEILTTPLTRPIFVTGLQRSGTTLLQRLLGRVTGARTISAWEALEPAPELDWQAGGRELDDPRFRRARRAERWMQRLAPDLFAVHPMDAAAPEEEVVLMDHGWMTQVSEVTYHVPSYREWLERQDATPAYTWLSRAMKLLAFQRAGTCWVLKTPQHLEYLDVLFAVFPDAVVVQTHRDPATSIASYSSMIGHLRGLMSDHVDPRAIGDYALSKVDRLLDRAMAVRDGRGGAGFIDVDYRELVGDPSGVLDRVCSAIGIPPLAEAEVRSALATERQHRHGVHRYRAGDFGLDDAAIRGRFGVYRARFGLD